MKRIKNQLDEMQEQKLLHIEKNGCWFAYWGLLVSIFVQQALYTQTDYKAFIGEWIIFMGLSLYLAFSCIKNGIWDRRLKPNAKTNFWLSIIAAVLFGIIFAVIGYMNYRSVKGAVVTFIVMTFLLFVILLIALTIASIVYKKRVDKMENDEEM